MRFIAVNKERAPLRPIASAPRRSYAGLHKIADAALARMARTVRVELKRFRAQIPLSALADALQRQRRDLAEAVFPWEQFKHQAMLALQPIIHDLVKRGGAEAAARMRVTRAPIAKAKKDDDKTLAIWQIFRSESPEAEKWARENAGTLIQGITEESQAAVRDAIATSINTGQDYGKSAQQIKDAVGLTRQGARAVDNYRTSLEDQDMAPDRVDQLAGDYSERLLKQRAETISRTETIDAVNRGQMTFWQQLMGDGVVDRGKAMKQWVVTPDDRLCPICADMDGTTVGVDDQFMSSAGSVDGPPLHPNCRCAVNLLPEGEDT